MNECDQRLYRVLSSRRRDTIYWRDWSSDVCSSDLDRMVTPAPVDEYVAGLPGDMRQRVDQVRRLVAAAVPGAAEDRKSVVEGKGGDLGGRRIIKKKRLLG